MTNTISYIESSIILSILLEDDHYSLAVEVWNNSIEKASSILTPIEILTVVRRFYSNKKVENVSLRAKEKRAEELLKEISILNIDQDIRRLIEIKREFSECRTLDAIHVASGFYLKHFDSEINIKFYSFDKRINQVAKKMGLKPHFG